MYYFYRGIYHKVTKYNSIGDIPKELLHLLDHVRSYGERPYYDTLTTDLKELKRVAMLNNDFR